MKFIRIDTTNNMLECSDKLNVRNIRKKLMEHALTSGSKRIQHLYSWENDGSEVQCYGWRVGEAGAENIHDLPPSGTKQVDALDHSDTQLLFGDIFIIQKQSKYCDIDISEYGIFYSERFGGFDDCDDDDDEDDEEGGEECGDEEMADFIVTTDGSSSDDNDDYEPEELEEDTFDY